MANLTTCFQKQDLRPAAVFVDVDGLEIGNFKPQVAGGITAATISTDVRGVKIYHSPLLQH